MREIPPTINELSRFLLASMKAIIPEAKLDISEMGIVIAILSDMITITMKHIISHEKDTVLANNFITMLIENTQQIIREANDKS